MCTFAVRNKNTLATILADVHVAVVVDTAQVVPAVSARVVELATRSGELWLARLCFRRIVFPFFQA